MNYSQSDVNFIISALSEVITKLRGYSVPARSVTFGDWLAEWVETYKTPRLKPTSLYQLDVCIRLHTPPELKATPIADLTSPDLQRALGKIKSVRMRKYTYDTWSDSLRKATQLEYIRRNPMDCVEPVKHVRSIGKALTVRQQADYLERIRGHKLEKLFRFYLLTGCRASEALTVTPADVDLENNLLHIRGTKTLDSDRYIPLFPEVKKLLAGIKRKPNEPYFPYTRNYAYVQQARVSGYSIKDLRHTFATRCFESGIPIEVYKRWLGHSKTSRMTEAVYTHLDEVQFREAKKFTLFPKV